MKRLSSHGFKDDEEEELQPYSDSESENGDEESSEENVHRGAFDSDSENEDLPEVEPTPEVPSAWELLKGEKNDVD